MVLSLALYSLGLVKGGRLPQAAEAVLKSTMIVTGTSQTGRHAYGLGVVVGDRVILPSHLQLLEVEDTQKQLVSVLDDQERLVKVRGELEADTTVSSFEKSTLFGEIRSQLSALAIIKEELTKLYLAKSSVTAAAPINASIAGKSLSFQSGIPLDQQNVLFAAKMDATDIPRLIPAKKGIEVGQDVFLGSFDFESKQMSATKQTVAKLVSTDGRLTYLLSLPDTAMPVGKRPRTISVGSPVLNKDGELLGVVTSEEGEISPLPSILDSLKSAKQEVDISKKQPVFEAIDRYAYWGPGDVTFSKDASIFSRNNGKEEFTVTIEFPVGSVPAIINAPVVLRAAEADSVISTKLTADQLSGFENLLREFIDGKVKQATTTQSGKKSIDLGSDLQGKTISVEFSVGSKGEYSKDLFIRTKTLKRRFGKDDGRMVLRKLDGYHLLMSKYGL